MSSAATIGAVCRQYSITEDKLVSSVKPRLERNGRAGFVNPRLCVVSSADYINAYVVPIEYFPGSTDRWPKVGFKPI